MANELCPKCGSEMVRSHDWEQVAGGLARSHKMLCPLDPKDCRIKELERQLEEAKAENEAIRTTNRFDAQTVYQDLRMELELGPEGSVLDAVAKLRSEREAHEVTKKALQEIADRGPNGRVDYPRASDFMDSGGHVDEDYEAYGFAYANWCEQQTSDIAKAALAREEARKKEVKG